MTSVNKKSSKIGNKEREKTLLKKEKELKKKLTKISSELEETRLSKAEKKRTKKIYNRFTAQLGIKKRKRQHGDELADDVVTTYYALSIEDTLFLILDETESIKDITALLITHKDSARFLDSDKFRTIMKNRAKLHLNGIVSRLRYYKGAIRRRYTERSLGNLFQTHWNNNGSSAFTRLELLVIMEEVDSLLSTQLTTGVKTEYLKYMYVEKEDTVTKLTDFFQNRKGGNLLLATDKTQRKPEDLIVNSDVKFSLATERSQFRDCFVSNGKKMISAQQYFKSRGYTVYGNNEVRPIIKVPCMSVFKRIKVKTFARKQLKEDKILEILQKLD